jgi:hypothetical protein
MAHRILVLSAVACLMGSVGRVPPTLAQTPDQSAPDSPRDSSRPDRRGRPHHRIDFAAAADKLGTTEPELRSALGLPEQPSERPRPNLAAAATTLGITEAQLQQALGISDSQTGERPRPNLQVAAEQLGITGAELRSALQLPERGDRENRPRRPQLDIAGAAETLGVTEAEIVEALGIPARSERPARSGDEPGDRPAD